LELTTDLYLHQWQVNSFSIVLAAPQLTFVSAVNQLHTDLHIVTALYESAHD
jgi:hypothetical protein